MKEVYVPRYECEICKKTYDSKIEAMDCESRPLSEDKGVSVGKQVMVLKGEDAGKPARVTQVFVVCRDWGLTQWRKYWHTVAVVAELENEEGNRILLFDDYTPILETK